MIDSTFALRHVCNLNIMGVSPIRDRHEALNILSRPCAGVCHGLKWATFVGLATIDSILRTAQSSHIQHLQPAEVHLCRAPPESHGFVYEA